MNSAEARTVSGLFHAYAKALVEDICRATLFWYAFTGCGTVSQFLGKKKKNSTKYLGKIFGAKEPFIRLSCVWKSLGSDIKIIENFVVLLYDAWCPHARVNDGWKYLFSKLNHTIDQCFPIKHALEQHILRAMLQGYIWSKSTQLKEQSIATTYWRWDDDERRDINPLWTTLPKASKACKELKNYKRKYLCSRGTCTCKTYAMPCSELCRWDNNWYHFFNDEVREGEHSKTYLSFDCTYINGLIYILGIFLLAMYAFCHILYAFF